MASSIEPHVGQECYAMMASPDAHGHIAVEANDYMGETPVWSTAEQSLYWINCENPPQLCRWNAASRATESWPMPERIGGIALRNAGDPIVCLASGVYNFNLSSGKLSLLAPSPFSPHVALHESFVDRSGRLWVGGMDQSFAPDNPWPGGAAICRLEGNELIVMIPGISIANSLAFSPDGTMMYFADSLRRLIWQVEIEPVTGAIRGMREFIRLNETEVGDGATVDTDGGYWLAVYGAGELRRYRPDGTLDRVVEVPFSQPTKPAFGGPDLSTLYITSTQIDVPGFARSGSNGAIYAYRSGVKGLAEVFFAG